MERLPSGEQKNRQGIIDDMLRRANKKAAEVLGRKPKPPEEKLRPVLDIPKRPAEAEFEHAEGVHIVGEEELASDEMAGDSADQWLNKHDPERRKDGPLESA